MIDGLYLRQSLQSAPIGSTASVALVENHLDAQLKEFGG